MLIFTRIWWVRDFESQEAAMSARNICRGAALLFVMLSFCIVFSFANSRDSETLRQNRLSIDYSTYPDFNELTTILKNFAETYPSLSKLKSAGKSLQGRELWYMEITDFATGEAETKPAVYMDGNMHAGEVTGASICLKTIQYLLEEFGGDPSIAELLKNYAFYIFPRVSPDGAEFFLKTPHFVRSVLRPYPFLEDQDGLYPEDIDGDGHIVQMRIESPDGNWKVSKKDSRLMLRRAASDGEGPFYHIYTEGFIRNYDGKDIKIAPPKYGVDLNRNFPANWSPFQNGAGPFPLSEPESRAIADLVREHPNIGARVCYHTAVGTINRPFNTKPDDKMPAKDLAAYKILGKIGKRLTGYPMVSVHDEFGTKNDPLGGTSLEWHYEHMGLFSFVFEAWNVEQRAGCGGYERKIPANRTGNRYVRTVEEDLKLLKWNDDVLAGEGFKVWESFDNHPQLGKVEIGGWRRKFTLMNPPEELLENEIDNDMMFAIEIAELLPLVRLSSASISEESQGMYKVSVTVKNVGFFPTNLTEQAKLLGRAKIVKVELIIDSGGELLGFAKQDVGYLEGTWDYDAAKGDPQQKSVSWLVKIKDPSEFRAKIRAVSEKGGIHELNLEIEGNM